MTVGRTTRSGAIFSPFQAVNVGLSLDPLVKEAVYCEIERDECESDDAEGWPLAYGTFPSPLTSPESSPCSSRSASPMDTHDKASVIGKKASILDDVGLYVADAEPSTTSTTASAVTRQDSSRPRTHKQAGYYKRRQKKRAAAQDAITRKIRSSQSRRYQELEVIKNSFNVRKLPVTRVGFIGKRFDVAAQHISLESYLAEGFRVVEWDGKSTLGLTDDQDRLFGVLVGPPTGDESWPAVVDGVRAALNHAKRSIKFSWKQDRRGTFKTVATGLSYGGGQMKPGILKHTKRNTNALKHLMGNPSIRRVLGYGNSVFKFYFPKVYQEYADNIDALLDHHTEFGRPIADTVFAAASFNFGPDVVTYEHTDSGNKANGLCPIFCSGTFDPRKGGHLVLRQLKLLVQFPSGSLALVPSATLKHANVPIQPGEQRESFTQYAAGGLFRWVQYGFRSWKSLSADSTSLKRELLARETRWKDAVAKFSTVASLHEDRMRLFS